MCGGYHVLSKIPTKIKSAALGFYVRSLVIIILTNQVCWAYNFYRVICKIEDTLQFLNIGFYFIIFTIPLHHINSSWFKLCPTNSCNSLNVHFVYFPKKHAVIVENLVVNWIVHYWCSSIREKSLRLDCFLWDITNYCEWSCIFEY